MNDNILLVNFHQFVRSWAQIWVLCESWPSKAKSIVVKHLGLNPLLPLQLILPCTNVTLLAIAPPPVAVVAGQCCHHDHYLQLLIILSIKKSLHPKSYFPSQPLPYLQNPNLPIQNPSFLIKNTNFTGFRSQPPKRSKEALDRVDGAVVKAHHNIIAACESVSEWKVSQSVLLALQVDSWNR